jgi:hypothetical protein
MSDPRQEAFVALAALQRGDVLAVANDATYVRFETMLEAGAATEAKVKFVRALAVLGIEYTATQLPSGRWIIETKRAAGTAQHATAIDAEQVEAAAKRREAAIESMLFAIFDERCPGIGFHDADRPIYRMAAIAALTVLGAI